MAEDSISPDEMSSHQADHHEAGAGWAAQKLISVAEPNLTFEGAMDRLQMQQVHGTSGSVTAQRGKSGLAQGSSNRRAFPPPHRWFVIHQIFS
jgi:hypothetical protein